MDNPGTEVFLSCSAKLFDEFFIFGSWDYANQVSKISGCGVERIGELPFNFLRGTCNTYAFPDERIFMCFDVDNPKKCRR